MALHLQQPSWHAGELAVHRLVHVPTPANPTAAGFPARYGHRVQQSPLVALGALDGGGRPWTTVWGGTPGFARPIGHDLLMAGSLVDAEHDPVVSALFGGGGGDGGGGGGRRYQMGPDEFASGGGKVVSGLSIDLATRDRVKVGGRLVEGGVVLEEPGPLGGGGGEKKGAAARAEVVVLVEEGLGNCPKYLNRRDIRAAVPEPRLVSDALPLPDEAVALLGKADLFFLSTASADGRTMDTNHRGGPPGFVRVMRNSGDGGVDLVYPEYSGNRLYQSLGNMHARPLVGICVPDFDAGDVLYLTGETQILAGADAARVLPHTRLAVRIRVTAARFVARGLPFRGGAPDYSPYNPPVRRLAAEKADPAALPQGADPGTAKPPATATLVGRDIITPTIARFTFRLEAAAPAKLAAWRPGQHVTLDFSPELDAGWSHMRDDDPASLNDDFVRTFTVSNAAPAGGDTTTTITDGAELQITARRHGPATGLLWRHNTRVPLELPVLGFGGSDEFRAPVGGSGGGEGEETTKEAVFVAGGVGITPVLAQAPGLLSSSSNFFLLWSLRAADLPLALDSFARCDGLAARSRLFVSGDASAAAEDISRLRGLGAEVKAGRLTRDDVLRRGEGASGGGHGRKFYCCAGPGLVKALLGWLEDEEMVYESFQY